MADDAGMTTLEAAMAVSILVGVAAMIIAGIATLAAYIRVVDTAGAAARAHAIGEEFAPVGATVTVTVTGGMVEVTARDDSFLIPLSAQARFPQELADGNR
ncbi:hypothetical protein PAB09_01490 [Corynebacterium sp. SCR221107]|uniref:hypothetical protein n=1 Tax=Corynebacterium sp. SCR221107 TaxID=3017361 RepID=UPI0022EC99BA|nr:hypothetical protein [Corynebacterium sp. SCR221107]WBT09047.1 hypothetical protein PAB09_01490 [Corynebacterium sp. SCR221107]